VRGDERRAREAPWPQGPPRPDAAPGRGHDARHGIRVTTPARTLLDLAATVGTDALHRALDRTEILELTDYPALDAIARTHPNHRGATPLRAAVRTWLAGTKIRSDLEELFLALCRRHGPPRPIVNGHVQGFEVDFLFAEQRLIVEIDSWRYHKTSRAFDADRARDAVHLQNGYRTVRFSDRLARERRHERRRHAARPARTKLSATER
jgi:Protein of unknown function (DUF559)